MFVKEKRFPAVVGDAANVNLVACVRTPVVLYSHPLCSSWSILSSLSSSVIVVSACVTCALEWEYNLARANSRPAIPFHEGGGKKEKRSKGLLAAIGCP